MKEETNRIRIDKWLWAVRQYKTRSLATHACDQGKIHILDQPVKPSRLVKEGDVISIKRTGLTRKLKVLKITENRLSPKLVIEYMTDLTPIEELDAYKARITKMSQYRDPGAGRPTKRERRHLDDFLDHPEEE